MRSVSERIDMHLQKWEGDYRLIGAFAGLVDCLNSIFWRGDLPAALCAIAVRMLGLDLTMPDSQVRIKLFLVVCRLCHWSLC